MTTGSGGSPMEIRAYRSEDASAVALISRTSANREIDFALNPLWKTETEFATEFERFDVDPASHRLVADSGVHG